MKVVSQGVRKKDAMSLVTGKPVYTDDIAPGSCLIVKLLRSPHAHALVEDIDTEKAKKIPGIECVLTYQEVPQSRFTTAGQSYPEASPYDRLILDRRLRCVGDPVAIVAGSDEKAVNKALESIKVKYEVLEPLIDFREAKDHRIVVHPENDYRTLLPVGAYNQRNLCASKQFEYGNVEEEFKRCAHIIEQTYRTKANQQTMMETFRTFTTMDAYGRLNVTTSTQVPFHARRILANALQIPKSKIRVIKPRIGGGFGAKQSIVSELYPAVVTWMTGKPAKMVYTRQESFAAGRPRHESEIKIRLGADENGMIQAIHMDSLWNAGAYGDHGPTTVGLSGNKSMAVYGQAKAYKFDYNVVYTNTLSGGAFRSYGAAQGFFALESAVNELADQLGMDPMILRMKNMLCEGQVGNLMQAYDNVESLSSCQLDRCLAKVKEMIGWDEKFPSREMGDHKVRAVGCAVALQGSGIAKLDLGAVEIRLNDDGFYTLMIGSTDMGTGCDTILSQIAAEALQCDYDSVIVQGVDTDLSPYDKGSYASSTTYVTGMAVVKTCEALKKKIMAEGARLLGRSADAVGFDGQKVYTMTGDQSVTLKDIANNSLLGWNHYLTASESHSSPISPPPFMAGAVEIELDKLTGKVDIVDFAAAIDCGTVINPNLARVQAEGGIVQGIGMALFEEALFSPKGRLYNDSFLKYKIPTRLDVGNIRVAFESSYEPTGPFGAKSIGEVVINTSCPAIAHAIHNATQAYFRELPITGEKILMGMLRKDEA
ncbi:MAG TPA: aldehyde oxidase [Peptococcaceae bacterium]|nr:aldehyde oxidase [Peptococcaceae bacterium]